MTICMQTETKSTGPKPTITLDLATVAIQQLPNLPTSTRQLLAYLNDDDIDLKLVLRAIECDAALTISVLRIANSPFYGMSNQVKTIGDAVLMMGIANVRMVVVTAMVSSLKFPNVECAQEIRKVFRHGLAVAICASIIGSANGFDSGTLFLAGILHDIGILALMSTYPELHRESRELAVQQNLSLHGAEHRVFGFDHADIGASLCRHWHLPESIVHAIEGHHAICDMPSTVPQFPLAVRGAGVIHVSNAIAHQLNLEQAPHSRTPTVSDAIWNTLIKQPEVHIGELTEMRNQYQELVTLIAL